MHARWRADVYARWRAWRAEARASVAHAREISHSTKPADCYERLGPLTAFWREVKKIDVRKLHTAGVQKYTPNKESLYKADSL